ncbi:MAG: outer membrane lipoprotein carrier protein LolA [Clostridiales bacterium]|nr:outer membrane lipoprotein carrier protein LolA [Clostridiales bacterium]
MKDLFLAACLCFLWARAFLWTATLYSPQQVAQNIEKRLASLRSLQADFEQAYFSSSISTPLKEKGKVYFQKPDLMRWEYLEPEEYVYLYKKGLSLAYFPEDNQLFRRVLTPEEKESELFTLLLGQASLEASYTVEPASFPSEKKDPLQIKLVPKQGGNISYILLEADEKTWLVQKFILFDSAGNKQEFHFSRIRPNPRLPANIFELDIPPDCEIIDDYLPIKND